MSSLIQFLAPSIPQSSPAGRVRRWPAPLGRRGERTIRAIVSLAAALAALVLFATATHGQTTSIDLMQGRPIEQGTDWARYDVVLEVPSNAAGVSFGVLLFGQARYGSTTWRWSASAATSR
jgi:hypothetical protein